MFHILRNNKGSTMAIIAVMAFVLLGFTAVAVDTGNVIVQKQKLQNAVDAAALAAASKLPNTTAARDAAGQYIQKNGFAPSDITVSFGDNNNSVSIRASKTVEYMFARVFGLKGTTVTPYAKAMIGRPGQAFDYVIFSGSKTVDLILNGSKYDITGSTHTNSSFSANGSNMTITGACEAMGAVSVKAGLNIPNKAPGSPYIAMPDFSETILQQAQAAGTYFNGDKTFYSSSIDVSKPIYVNGNVTINGSGFKGVGCLLATGNITFNGSSQYVTASDAVAVYSKNGNICFNGAHAIIEGIMYAPNGEIRFNGAHQTVHGRVIANTVEMNGSDYEITVKGDIDELKALPPDTIRLVR